METKLGSKTILVVDDDAAIRRMLNKTLAYVGYQVIEASDGQEAFEKFQSEPPDLVLSDIYMPVMNGIHLLRAIRRTNENAKVVLMTGYGHFAQLASDWKSRPDGYFEKPISIHELLVIIAKLIGSPGRISPSAAAEPAARGEPPEA